MNSTTDGAVGEFRSARKRWLEDQVGSLADTCEVAAPFLYKSLPSNLGDQRLVAAVMIARVAADEARARPVAETIAWLERLIPSGHRHDVTQAVRQLRSRIAFHDDPALWAWNAEDWEEMLLWWWRRHQPRTGDPARDFAEWEARWSAAVPWNGDIDDPEEAPRRHGRDFVALADFFTREPEPLRLLAQAVLRASRSAASVEDAVLLREEHLQGARHLRWLAEQQAGIEQIEAWRRKQQETASEATRAFLAELSEAVRRYMNLMLEPVVKALSTCERGLLDDSRHGSRRSATDYLGVFLDWQAQPAEDHWDHEVLSTDVTQQAREIVGRGGTTWHGMLGTVPVWYHIVTSPQEKAAALAFSGKPSGSVIRVKADGRILSENSGSFGELWDEPDESADWYPDPGIEIPYASDRVSDLCSLLAVSQLGHARLEFLLVRPDGTVRRLRTVQARVHEDDAAMWRRWALAALAEIAPDPEDLADLMARQEQQQTEDEPDETRAGTGSGDGSFSRPDASGPGRPSTGNALPAELLARVKALLRKAEDQAATEEEARAYLAKATELMAKYGIEQAMLDGLDQPAGPTDKLVEVQPPYAKEMRRLLSWIASAMRCPSVYPGGKASKHRVHLFGYAGDIQASEVLFASLRLQMLAGAHRADLLHRPAGEDARAYKRSWMLGFIREVTNRVKAAQDAARTAAEHEREAAGASETGGRSVALVLANRSAVVDARLSDRYPKLGKTRRTTFKGSGYWQGITDGKDADIGGPAFGQDTRNVQLHG